MSYPLLEQTGIVNHGFSTRIGGVSEGIFSSMNLSFTRGDDEERVRENFKRMAETIGVEADSLVFAAQTHTTNVRVITEEDKEGIPDMVSKMDMRYFDCVIQCKIDKATGRTTWSTYTTPVVFDCEVKMFGTHAVKMGLSFEKEYVITY